MIGGTVLKNSRNSKDSKDFRKRGSRGSLWVLIWLGGNLQVKYTMMLICETIRSEQN